MKRKLMPFLLIAAFALMAGSSSLYCQNFQFPLVPGYKTVQDYPVYTPGDLWDYINGAADAYLSYGFSELFIAEYVKGKNSIKVEVYDHLNPIRGFGIYSLERSPGYSFVSIGAQGYMEPGLVHFFKDRYYVKVMTNSGNKKILRSLEPIARRVAETLPGSDEMPGLLMKLPANGRLVNEEMYINESVLGHGFLRGAIKAGYDIDGNVFTLYLFSCETADMAADAVAAYLERAGLVREEGMSGKYQFRDGYNGNIFLVWNSATFAVLTGLGTEKLDFVNSFVSQIPGLR
ncbi:MAG: hypothetical protein RBS37_10120 [Bacteroidales bacterium]|jgi:hypothetical protein|nr:hypothetical protein [Bacteroidales bacterium]